MGNAGTSDSSHANTYRVPAVHRALNVLELLAREHTGLKLSDLAARSHLPKSSLHNILHTLSEHRFVMRDQLGDWALRPRAYEVGVAYGAYRDLVGAFRQVARSIVAACGETVQMAVLDGREVVYIAKVEGTQPVRLVSHEGARLPAHATPLARRCWQRCPRRNWRTGTATPPGRIGRPTRSLPSKPCVPTWLSPAPAATLSTTRRLQGACSVWPVLYTTISPRRWQRSVWPCPHTV